VKSPLRNLLAMTAAGIGIILALPIIVVALPFWIVALLTSSIARALEPRFVTWKEIIEYYPAIGWKPRPNLDTHHLSDDVFRMTTDGEGWRGKSTVSESHIVVLGDSFAFGYGVDDKDFFANVNPTFRIKAIGASGYNMVQEFLWLERLSPLLQGKLVVWLIYFGNDLYENLVPDMYGYRMPFVRQLDGTREWEIVTSHVGPAKWPFVDTLDTVGVKYYQKLAELCGPTFLSARAYPACAYLIQKGRDICKQVGAKLVVVSIPDITQLSQSGRKRLASLAPDPETFDPELPDRKVRETCTNLGVPFVALKDHLELSDYKESDCHWNQKGHRRVAELLTVLYRQHMFQESPTSER